MNIIQMATATVGLIVTIGGVAWAGLNEFRALDQKYVPLSEWQDFQWTQLKRELRQIGKDIAEAEFRGNEEYAEDLAEAYEELLEFICRKYPDDREC